MKHSITEQLTSRIVNEVLNEVISPFTYIPLGAYGVGHAIGDYLFGEEGPGERRPIEGRPMVDPPQQSGEIGIVYDDGGYRVPGVGGESGKPQTPFRDRGIIANPGDAGPLPYGTSPRSYSNP